MIVRAFLGSLCLVVHGARGKSAIVSNVNILAATTLHMHSIDKSASSTDSSNTFDNHAHELWCGTSKFNIPHNEIRGLLGVFSTYHPHLPKAPRAVLKTQSQYNYEIKTN